MVLLSFAEKSEEYRGYESLTQLGVQASSLDTGCHQVDYSSETDGPTKGGADSSLVSCEIWDGMAIRSASLRAPLETLFGTAPNWLLPAKPSKLLQTKLKAIDQEVVRLRKLYQKDPDIDRKIAQDLYHFTTSTSGLGISPVDVVRENSAATVLAKGEANCSEFFSTLYAVFSRAGLKIFPVYVFESASGDTTPHIAAGLSHGGRTYLIDPFYGGFDTPHRRWAPLSLREYWAWQFNNRGLLTAHAGDLKKAGLLFDWAARLDPHNPHIPNNLGLSLDQAKKPREAEQAYRQAIAVDAKFVEPYLNLAGLMLGEKRYQEALVPLKQGLNLRAKDHRLWYNLASAYFELKKNKLCLAAINEAIQLDRANSDYYLLRADLYTRLGKTKQAEADRSKAASLNQTP